ncbi:MAG: outer membrane beta-barrel protein [Methylovirgula sp.]|uniref:outer membrane protein n=1 Tax=Methylovirgula sp. TaxID=1978224 RepID=UPI00307618DC
MIRSFALAAISSAILGSVAMAADLPSEKGPPVYAPPPPVFSWTGVYIGGQVGYEWGHTSVALDVPGGPATGFHDQGVVGGGHVGYNYEIGSLGGFLPGLGGTGGGIVVGIEGDVNGASYTGSDPALAGTILLRDRTEVDASIRGRVGVAFDRVLIYGTGGAAFGSIRNSLDAPGLIGEAHETGRVGWTAGGGIEYAIDNNWSIRAEYRYTDYGHYDTTYTSFPVVGPFSLRYHDTDNRVQAGFSYKFDEAPPPAPPVVAKY